MNFMAITASLCANGLTFLVGCLRLSFQTPVLSLPCFPLCPAARFASLSPALSSCVRPALILSASAAIAIPLMSQICCALAHAATTTPDRSPQTRPF